MTWLPDEKQYQSILHRTTVGLVLLGEIAAVISSQGTRFAPRCHYIQLCYRNMQRGWQMGSCFACIYQLFWKNWSWPRWLYIYRTGWCTWEGQPMEVLSGDFINSIVPKCGSWRNFCRIYRWGCSCCLWGRLRYVFVTGDAEEMASRRLHRGPCWSETGTRERTTGKNGHQSPRETTRCAGSHEAFWNQHWNHDGAGIWYVLEQKCADGVKAPFRVSQLQKCWSGKKHDIVNTCMTMTCYYVSTLGFVSFLFYSHLLPLDFAPRDAGSTIQPLGLCRLLLVPRARYLVIGCKHSSLRSLWRRREKTKRFGILNYLSYNAECCRMFLLGVFQSCKLKEYLCLAEGSVLGEVGETGSISKPLRSFGIDSLRTEVSPLGRPAYTGRKGSRNSSFSSFCEKIIFFLAVVKLKFERIQDFGALQSWWSSSRSQIVACKARSFSEWLQRSLFPLGGCGSGIIHLAPSVQ